MSIKAGIALLAAAAIVAAAGPATALSGQTKSAFVVDFSADKDKKEGKDEHKRSGQPGNQGGAKKSGGQVEFEKKKGGQQGGQQGGGKKGGGNAEFEKQKGGQHVGGVHKGTATAKRMHGLAQGHGQTAIRGHNFSTWRGGRYRVHYHDRWVTFVPLTALAVIAIGGASFYPYAYIDAPQDFCGGFTEDDCELRWRDVETVEGDVIGQCVAYCPWQD